MALVRCPTHNIPYNDANPRGCPACWKENQGGDQSTVMRELARASRGMPAIEVLEPEPAPDDAAAGSRRSWPPPVTTPPRLPMPEPTRLERVWNLARANWTAVMGIGAVLVAATLVYLITKPTFRERFDPPYLVEEARPFPITPGMTIEAGFALFGTVPPSVNPDSPTLARYRFAPGVAVDAFNSAVYAVTLTTTERSWTGNRVGLTESLARGRLALLGEIREEQTRPTSPFPVGPWLVFPSAATRAVRTLAVHIRPPNGCYDVYVGLAPRIIGDVTRGDEVFVAVARRGGVPEWVAVQVRVVSRAIEGPYAEGAEC